MNIEEYYFIYNLHWLYSTDNTYLYGSDFQILENGIISYKNELIPASMVIYEWKFSPHYQLDRYEPLLPLLQAGKDYFFEPRYSTIPENTLITRIEFYDSEEKRIEYHLIRERTKLTCPENMMHYKVQLVSAGCKEVLFDSVVISDTESEYIFQRNKEEKYTINVLCTEPIGETYILPYTEPLERLGNLIVLKRNEMPEEMIGQLEKKISDHFRVNFIGYGDISNEKALEYKEMLPGSSAYIYRPEKNLKTNGKKVFYYGQKKIDNAIWVFMGSMQRTDYRLAELHLSGEKQ